MLTPTEYDVTQAGEGRKEPILLERDRSFADNIHHLEFLAQQIA